MSENNSNDKLLKVRQVMERLALSRSATYGLMQSGVLPNVKLPGTGSRCHRRVRPADLQRFIDTNIIGAER